VVKSGWRGKRDIVDRRSEESSMNSITKVSMKEDVRTNFAYVINIRYAVHVIIDILSLTEHVKIFLPCL